MEQCQDTQDHPGGAAHSIGRMEEEKELEDVVEGPRPNMRIDFASKQETGQKRTSVVSEVKCGVESNKRRRVSRDQAGQQGVVTSDTALAQAGDSEGEIGVVKAEVADLGANADVLAKEVAGDHSSSHTGAGDNIFKGTRGKIVQSSLKQFFNSKERKGSVSGANEKEPEAKLDNAAADKSNKLLKKADGVG